MNTQEVAARVLRQRMGRFTDTGPSLGGLGTARFRVEPGKLRVAYATLAPGAARAVLRTVQRDAERQGREVHWTVVPTRAGEQELPDALREAGFRLEEHLLLMAHEGPIAPEAANPAVLVVPIHSYQAMWEYEYGSRQCFYDEPRPSDALVGHRASERWREQEHGWCRYYAALLDGQPVGGCYVSLYEEIPTLMGVYALPHVRRRGVARTLLQRAVGEIITPANPLTCLFVEQGNPAEILYRGLVFVLLYESFTYAP
jgi:GNAT superfamily N-acetyltransferase